MTLSKPNDHQIGIDNASNTLLMIKFVVPRVIKRCGIYESGESAMPTVEQRGDEDEGRAGGVRRRLSRAAERAQELARGILGRLRRRGG